MENDPPKCSKETIHETEPIKTSELESNSFVDSKDADIEHEELAILENEIEVIVGVSSSNGSKEDCSGPSICTDGEIICELNDVSEELKDEVEFIESKGNDVQFKVDIGKNFQTHV